MSVQVFCPKCDRSCRLKEELLGRRVRCPGCQEIFKAEEVPVADAEPEPEESPELALDRLDDDDSDRPRKKKELRSHDHGASVVKPGKVQNPFDEGSRLTGSSAPVDASLFAFDYGDEPPAKKKSDSDRKKKEAADHDDDRKRSRRDEEDDDEPEREDERKSKRAPAEKPTSKSKSNISLPQGKRPVPEAAREEASPFSFGNDDEAPSAGGAKGRQTPRANDDERPAKPKQAPEKKPAARKGSSDADFLGLQDMDELPQPLPDEPKPKKKSGKRRFFHVRQTGFWSEAHLFRVFIDADDMVFVTAASGKEVAEMEQAIAADSLDDCEKKIRNKLLDLDELPIDELAEGDPNSFCFAAPKIIAASINAPPYGLLRKHGAAVLLIVHKSKGEISFDFPSDEDVDRAIDYLPDLLDEVLEIHVRWDKASKRFIKR